MAVSFSIPSPLLHAKVSTVASQALSDEAGRHDTLLQAAFGPPTGQSQRSPPPARHALASSSVPSPDLRRAPSRSSYVCLSLHLEYAIDHYSSSQVWPYTESIVIAQPDSPF